MKKRLITTVCLAIAFTCVSNAVFAAGDCTAYLMGDITNGSAQSLIQDITTIEEGENCTDATVYILSGGGSIMSTFAIVGTISNMAKDVNTFCVGYCGSAAALVLAAGSGKRSMFSTSLVMIHQSSFDLGGDQYTDLLDQLESVDMINDMWADAFAHYTNMSKEEYLNIIEGRFEVTLSASDAKEMGFVDEIIPGMI